MGNYIEKTKRGKGTKIMAVADRAGLPVAVYTESAAHHEVVLVPATLAMSFVDASPHRWIGDRAYDSDPMEHYLATQDIVLIASHRRGRKQPKTQDGRPLRRYKRHWKVERLFAWLGNFHRLNVRYERYSANFRGFVLLGCLLILLRCYL